MQKETMKTIKNRIKKGNCTVTVDGMVREDKTGNPRFRAKIKFEGDCSKVNLGENL